MPKSKRVTTERVPIRIPKPIMDEIDNICSEYEEYSYNRQQFIETAIREKIEKIKSLGKKSPGPK